MKVHSGYTSSNAEKYINAAQPIHLLSTELEKQFEYADGKRTDNISGYKAWFSQEGAPAFTVKFANDFKLPKYMALVEFDNLQAIEIRYNVYFKANGLTEVK